MASVGNIRKGMASVTAAKLYVLGIEPFVTGEA